MASIRKETDIVRRRRRNRTETIRKFLSAWYDIEIAKTDEEAVLSCQKSPPDLVLMDLMMPHSPTYEGDEAIRRLTTDPRTSSIPAFWSSWRRLPTSWAYCSSPSSLH